MYLLIIFLLFIFLLPFVATHLSNSNPTRNTTPATNATRKTRLMR